MNLISTLHELGRDADPGRAGFQAGGLYLLVSVAMPVALGLIVGFGFRLVEAAFGIRLGRGGH